MWQQKQVLDSHQQLDEIVKKQGKYKRTYFITALYFYKWDTSVFVAWLNEYCLMCNYRKMHAGV